MPRVPSADGFNVGVANPGGRFSTGGGLGAGAIGARQADNMGQAMQQAGQGLGRIALDRQNEINEVRVIDAVTQAKEKLFDLQSGEGGFARLKGYEALQRPDGKMLADEYADKFKTVADELDASLGNDAQRQAFRRHADTMRTQMYGEAQRHVAAEFKSYQSATYDAAASAAKRQLALSYGDPDAAAQSVGTIRAATQAKARLLGMPQTWADEQAFADVSAAHRTAVRTALEQSDIDGAAAYLKRYGADMSPDDVVTVRSAVDRELHVRQASRAADTVVAQLAPKLVPSDFDRMVGITLQSESGGRRYSKDGQLLTSPAGAKGEMQVLDGTNKNPGFGVAPAKDDSPEERARVGRDYLRAMHKRYDGDTSKAWAAYNAGPGKVDDAVMRAQASRSPGANWLTFTPNETQAYVAKNLKALQAGIGAPMAPTVEDVQSAVRAQLGPDAPPQVVAAAITRAGQAWGAAVKSKADREDQTVAEAQRMLLDNGGDFSTLPPSVRASLPPGKVDDLMGFAAKLAKGERTATNWGLYYQLQSDPQLLRGTNLMALRDRLADTEFKQLADQQSRLSRPDGGSRTELQSARDVFNTWMKQAGMDPTPKDSDKSGAEKAGRMLGEFQARITAREQALGKKLDTAQLNEEAARLFKPVKVSGLIFNTETPAGMVTPKDRVSVPATERKQIVDSLKKAGRVADDATVEALYRAHHRIPQFQQAN